MALDVLRMAIFSVSIALALGAAAYVLREHVPLPENSLLRFLLSYVYVVIFADLLLFAYALSLLSCPIPSVETSTYVVECDTGSVIRGALSFAVARVGALAAILFPGWVLASYVARLFQDDSMLKYLVSAYAFVLVVMLWIYAFPWLLLRLS